MPGTPILPFRRSVAALVVLGALFALGARPARAAATDDAPDDKSDDKSDDKRIEGPEAEAPMKPEARALYERGLALYGQKDYAGATRVFEEGFALDAQPELLFADAQARRLSGDCRGAVPLYQRFLALGTSAVQTSATHIALARCAQQMANERPAAPPPVAPVPPPPPPPEPWTHDRLGAVLVGAGVVGLAVGGGFLAASFSARPTQANSGGSMFDDYASRYDTAERRLTIGVVGLATGGALAAGGVARYLWVRHRAKTPKTPATLTIVPGGLAVAGTF
jgi:hypothetical protein